MDFSNLLVNFCWVCTVFDSRKNESYSTGQSQRPKPTGHDGFHYFLRFQCFPTYVQIVYHIPGSNTKVKYLNNKVTKATKECTDY